MPKSRGISTASCRVHLGLRAESCSDPRSTTALRTAADSSAVRSSLRALVTAAAPAFLLILRSLPTPGQPYVHNYLISAHRPYIRTVLEPRSAGALQWVTVAACTAAPLIR